MPMISNRTDIFCDTHFIFRENSIILQGGALPDESLVRKCLELNVADDWFTEPEKGYSAMSLESSAPNPAGCTDIPLREFFHKTSAETACLAARARGLLNFKNDKRFCAKCGAALKDDVYFTARTCTRCGRQYFPQIEPAVITLVSRGDEILLARHRRSSELYSCIAGFVETGETIENAVRREVLEETGITIKDIRYVGSQPWPFPDQLMLAFRAEYDSGEIRIQESELTDAKWFTRENLPAVPKNGSIACRLISGEFD